MSCEVGWKRGEVERSEISVFILKLDDCDDVEVKARVREDTTFISLPHRAVAPPYPVAYPAPLNLLSNKDAISLPVNATNKLVINTQSGTCIRYA